MTSVEEVVNEIGKKGEQIRALKQAKPATLKEDLEPLVAELLALKLTYKELTGEPYDKPVEEKKKKEPTEPQGEPREGPSKTELNKMKRKAEKAAKRAAAKGEDEPASSEVVAKAEESIDPSASLYGDAPLIQSAFMTDRVYKNVTDLNESRIGQKFWIRGRLSNSRAVGKGIFLILRQGFHTAQAVMFQDQTISKGMVKYAASISLESIVDILVSVVTPAIPIQATTVKDVELNILEIHAVSKAQDLPFVVEDAARNEDVAAAENLPLVNQDTALNFRWIDMRTPANQAIFRIQSGVCQLFRDFFLQRDFVEIHTPKMIGGASEGGASVFKFQYFDQPACLAQSPQFYKQMAAACCGFEKVFEIGPVFRAENSNTHR